MSTNPYAPPESDLSKSSEQSVRPPFPFLSMGPLPWISAVLVIYFLWEVTAMPFPIEPVERIETVCLIAMITLQLSVIAGLYGMFYAFILRIICRMLYVTPRVMPHLWTIVLLTFVGVYAGFSPVVIFLSTHLAGAVMAISNFQEKVD